MLSLWYIVDSLNIYVISLNIYVILKEAHGRWELRENEHLEPQHIFFMNAKRSK